MHVKNVCEFGEVHSQCRCQAPDKAVVQIKCNMPNKHGRKDTEMERYTEMYDMGQYKLVRCNLCGAVVVDQDRHTGFHQQLNDVEHVANTAQTASQRVAW